MLYCPSRDAYGIVQLSVGDVCSLQRDGLECFSIHFRCQLQCLQQCPTTIDCHAAIEDLQRCRAVMKKAEGIRAEKTKGEQIKGKAMREYKRSREERNINKQAKT